MPKLVFRKSDFIYNWFSGTGAGGQHRNKHQNCLRLIHIETGLSVTAQNSRERTQNIKEAYQKILPLLYKHYNQLPDYPKNTDIIRSYKLEDNLVIDHRNDEKYAIQGLYDVKIGNHHEG